MSEGGSDNVGDNSVGITFDDVVAYMEAKGIPDKCTTCGHNELAIAIDRGGKAPALVCFDPSNVQIQRSTAIFYIQMICTNCGYMRLFERHFFDNWKREQGDSDVS